MGKKILCNIPCGWNVAKVEDIFYVLRGVTFPKSAKSEKADSYIGCLRTANVQQKVDWNDLWKIPEAYLTDEDKIVKEHDILISVANSLNLLGKSSYVSKVHQRSTFGTFIVNLRAKVDNPLLLYYFLQTRFFLDQVKDCASTTTNISNISTAKLKKLSVIVPPQPEQERIVAKIEELFSQLDAAVAELKSVKEKLAIYRQSVLKEAFEFENKDLVEISSIIEDIKIGPFGTMLHKCDYVVGGIPVINPQHIKNNVIVENQSIAISEKKAEELESYKLRTNDIIMGRRGEMGRVAPVSSRENGWLCGTGSIIIRLKQEYDSVLYSKILSSPQVVHFLEKMAKGTTMKNLNEKIVARIPVPQITRDIQNDILLNTSRKTSICDNIEQTVDTALQQAAALRQSILKQAFEGNL